MLGLVYDVHGNLDALEAVLADASSQGVERFLLGGDYALFGGRPAETLARLRELDATWIRGNGERWTARKEDAPEHVHDPIADVREALGGDVVVELAALDEQVVIDGVRYCHGSPVSDVRSFFPEPAEDEHVLLNGAPERRIVFGHTHLPFEREGEGGVLLVNPGSVGMPFDGNTRAAWGIDRGEAGVELRRVEYDVEAAAAAVRARTGEWAEVVARRIERASFDV